MERRLAAILIADVVGYTRLSQLDEERTRACFQADLHEVFEPTISAHHGRLVKLMGDGLLVEFHSVVYAVRCAADVQRIEAGKHVAMALEAKPDFSVTEWGKSCPTNTSPIGNASLTDCAAPASQNSFQNMCFVHLGAAASVLLVPISLPEVEPGLQRIGPYDRAVVGEVDEFVGIGVVDGPIWP